MSGKKDMDATKRLSPDEPTQETEKGLKIGLPKRSTVMDAPPGALHRYDGRLGWTVTEGDGAGADENLRRRLIDRPG